MKDILPFKDKGAYEVWKKHLKDEKDNSVEDMWRRVAKKLASVEIKDKKHWENEFYKVLAEFNTMAGRILSNIGTDANKASAINCFVLGCKNINNRGVDSIHSIMSMVSDQALTLRSEGGYGTNFSFLRPKGTYIKGIKSETCGTVGFMDIWDMTSDVITRGNGARTDKRAKKGQRGPAMMGILEIWHPDIEEFMEAKIVPNTLEKFNISVGLTDEFMEAVNKGKSWEFIFPDVEHPKYDDLWDGDINRWQFDFGFPVKVYKKVNARELYDRLIKSAYTRNDPGIVFISRMNYNNNLWYAERIIATNPCGEQPLPDGGVCLLGSLNMTNFINIESKNWNYEKLSAVIPVHIRMLDNVNDLAYVPLPIQRTNIANKRRIGQGILGYGSALAMMGIKYGSPEAIKITDEFCEFWANKAYQASAKLASEKGIFPLYNKKYLKSKYVERLSDETKVMIRKYGMRNSHILSIAPTGNTGVYANNTSGGCEPILFLDQVRSVTINDQPKGLTVYEKEKIDWSGKKKYKATEAKDWEWIKEGQERILKVTHNDITYHIDRNRGLIKDVPSIDYGVRWLKLNGKEEDIKRISTINDLTAEDHINTLMIFAKWVDSAISKTINLPHNYSFDKYKKLYMDVWKTGYIKGITTYRIGTMAGVIKNAEIEEIENIVINPIKLPDKYPSQTYTMDRHSDNEWYITSCYYPNIENKKPFAIFITANEHIKKQSSVILAEKLIELAKSKGIKINKHSLPRNPKAPNIDDLMRLVSLNLRHGVLIRSIVTVFDNVNIIVGTVLYKIKKYLMSFIADGIKLDHKKCPKCKSQLMYLEACEQCTNCDWKAC